jgi:hypothetical protein
MSTVGLAENLGFVDTANLFMYGESRGGMERILPGGVDASRNAD